MERVHFKKYQKDIAAALAQPAENFQEVRRESLWDDPDGLISDLSYSMVMETSLGSDGSRSVKIKLNARGGNAWVRVSGDKFQIKSGTSVNHPGVLIESDYKDIVRLFGMMGFRPFCL